MSEKTKYVYFFGAGHTEGNANMRNLLGGKGANLAEMAGLGLPVPQGFTISTEACTRYYDDGKVIGDDIQAQVMDYIALELPEILTKWFPLSRRREDNFLAGLSMGCYGTFAIGMNYPEKFCALGCFSALNITDLDPEGNDMDGGMIAVYGVKNNGAVAGTRGDLQVLAKNAIASGKPLPTIFHCCGTEDTVAKFVHPTVKFFSELEGNPFNYSYQTGPGGHDFDFWDEWIQKWLRTLPVYGEPQ